MKNNLLFLIGKTWRHRFIFVSLLASAFILNGKEAFSQEKMESDSKLSVTMNVSCKISDGIKNVKVQVTRKENKKTISVDNLTSPVNLYLNEVKDHNPADGTGLISKLYLNNEGEGFFEIPDNINKHIFALHEYTFIVNMDSDPVYEDAEEEIAIADAKITLAYSGEDSIKTASAVLLEWKDSAYVPVAEAELKLFIKRHFSLFPIGEEGLVTDEKGEVSADLPLDIPGSIEGTITIVAQIEDHESFGTVAVTKEVPWTVLPTIIQESGRTLWSSGDNAPLVLVISSLTIIAIIWGTIFYLITLLFKIRKISKEKTPEKG